MAGRATNQRGENEEGGMIIGFLALWEFMIHDNGVLRAGMGWAYLLE